MTRLNCDHRCKLFAALAFIAFGAPLSDSLAAVTFFGSVDPEPPGDGDVESTLSVGTSAAANNDFRGYVRIDDGDQIEYDSLIVGDDEEFRGEVIISGLLAPGRQSRLTVEEAGSPSAPTVQVGREGVGQLTIESTGELFFESAAGDLSIGVETSGVGAMTVTGNFSQVVVPDILRVGEDGIGRMEILDGAMVYNSDTLSTALIGANVGSVGNVLVDGAGSIWKIDDDLSIGIAGVGTLTVQNLGLVDIDRSASVATVGANGRLEVADGTFSGANITLDGYLGGSGLVRGAVTGSVDSLIDVPAGALLQFADDVANQGSLRIREGEAVFLANFENLAPDGQPAPGRVTLENGRVRFSQALANDGVIAATGGANDIHGEIANGPTGAIVIASDSAGTFYDSVAVGGGSIELLAGANGLFLADLVFASGGLANLQIASDAAESAQLHVSGAATLAGALEVGLAGEESPGLGDSYQLLFAAEGVGGVFETTDLPTLGPGLLWNLDYGANELVLEVLAAATADFNSDGIVDGDDLGIWEASFGINNGADADADGDTDGQDFLAWQRQTAGGSGQSVGRSVPEPGPAMLATLGLVLLYTRRGAGRKGITPPA